MKKFLIMAEAAMMATMTLTSCDSDKAVIPVPTIIAGLHHPPETLILFLLFFYFISIPLTDNTYSQLRQ